MSLTQSEWFTEIYGETTAFSVRYSRKVLDTNSDFQRIEIFDTDALGRVLILNGCFMVTETDSFIYHEMLVHPAMGVLSEPRKVLIIGGGDGGAVTEVVKYPAVEAVTLCEIDPLVVDACREHFPEISQGLSDPRAQVVCEDGAAFVKNFTEEFDLVLVDSTDPVGPGVSLFETTFYESIKKSLKKGGAAVFQTESPLFMGDVFSKAVRALKLVFGSEAATPYLATIPTYPGGLWSFTFCSERVDPVRREPWELPRELSRTLRYYDPQVHSAALALPVFVRKMLEDAAV
ncbi:MAG: polyamine aminopropyltransferase [Desulfomonilaceae bacterium]